MVNRMRVVVIAMCLALLAPASLHAGQTERRPRDRARTFLVVRIADELDLSDEKALQVNRVLKDAEKRRKELVAQRKVVESEIRAALGAGQAKSTELDRLLERATDIDRKLALVPEDGMAGVQALLSPEEQARLVLFRPRLRGQIRSAVRERLRHRRSHQARP